MITQDQLYDTRRMLGVCDEDKVPEVDRAIEEEFDIARIIGRRPDIRNIKDRLGCYT